MAAEAERVAAAAETAQREALSTLSTTSIPIHGPVSYYYYNITNKENKKNKKILLFGELYL